MSKMKKPWPEGSGLKVKVQRLYLGYVLCLQSFGAAPYFELDLVAFLEGLVAFAGDGFVMYEYIIAFFSGDKSIAFRAVEPLDSSFFH